MVEGVIPARRRVAQAEGLDGGVGQVTLLADVVQGEFPGRRGQVVTVESQRIFEERAQALVGFLFFRFLGPVRFEFDPRPLRHVSQCFLEVPAFFLHYELENVAALPALAEAAPGLPVGGNDERGCFLVVERAQAGIVLSGAAQLHGLSDQVYDVNAGFDLINLGHGV